MTRARPKFRLPHFLFLAGLSLTFLAGVQMWYEKRLTFSKQPSYAKVERRRDAGSTPAFIGFPNRQIIVSVQSGLIKDGFWPLSDTNAIFLASSSQPDEQGRVIIYGHDTPQIFGKLGLLTPGEPIQITAKNGNMYVYKVVSQKTVSPTDIGVLAPTDGKILTVYTCTGPFDTQRLIVNAAYQGQIL